MECCSCSPNPNPVAALSHRAPSGTVCRALAPLQSKQRLTALGVPSQPLPMHHVPPPSLFGAQDRVNASTGTRYAALNKCIAEVVEDFSLVSFLTLGVLRVGSPGPEVLEGGVNPSKTPSTAQPDSFWVWMCARLTSRVQIRAPQKRYGKSNGHRLARTVDHRGGGFRMDLGLPRIPHSAITMALAGTRDLRVDHRIGRVTGAIDFGGFRTR